MNLPEGTSFGALDGDMLATWAMQGFEAEIKTSESGSSASSLRVNRSTGKVETFGPPSLANRETSFNTMSVRRQISFVLDESLEECKSPSFRVTGGSPVNSPVVPRSPVSRRRLRTTVCSPVGAGLAAAY